MIEYGWVRIVVATQGVHVFRLNQGSASKRRWHRGAVRVKLVGMRVAGVDGCKAGWICLTRDLGSEAIESRCYVSAVELFAQQPAPDVVCIDIPIGLVDRGARECDLAARRVLGRPRASSVFPAPIRAVLVAESWEEACSIGEATEGKKIMRQTREILAKIREVDRELRNEPALRKTTREVHPEVSFWGWAGGPMAHRKRKRQGREERMALVQDRFGLDAYESVRAKYLAREVAHDDILDAFAALWTAERVVRGIAARLPSQPPIDNCGLRMEIVY